MPALLLLTGPSAGRRHELVSEVTIGRSPSCEVALQDDQASRRHARIVLRGGQPWLCDLGSFNGTWLNGERVEGEAVLRPGDRIQVGQTVALFEPPAASPGSPTGSEATYTPIEEVLPHVGTEGVLYSAGTALLGANTEPMMLRRLVDECVHALSADRVAALLGPPEALLPVATFGSGGGEVPPALVRAALERGELGRTERAVSAPLVASGGKPFGLLYVERFGLPPSDEEGRLLAALGRLGGEAYAAVRARLPEALPSPVLIGGARPWRKALEQAERAATSSAPVTLAGEPGTGKALLARFLHARSPRARGPLVEVDCRLAPPAVDAMLFGHPGAPGVPPTASALLRADGGSLLLLHVEALARPTAERLTRLLARKAAPAPRGGEEPVDARLLVTCAAPLSLLAVRGEVDAALARVLAGPEVELPPLRERRTDVLGLFEHFAAQAAHLSRKGPPQLTPEARRLLVDYAWPQNVRELRLLTERLAVLYAGEQVHALRLPPELQEGEVSAEPRSLQSLTERLERDAIAQALRQAGGKKIRAAELLGISRPTLDKKMESYALTVQKGRRG
ncbi:FHA domain-containing protein [Myxococcaceae bacterium GXIMD 01537]